MVVIVFLGLAFALLAMLTIFVLMFVDVAFKPPQASSGPLRFGQAELSRPLESTGQAALPRKQIREVAAVAPPSLQGARSEAGIAVNRHLLLSRHTRHLRVLLLLIIGGFSGVILIRSQLIPHAYGDRGPYRAGALNEIASQPSLLTSDSSCLKCHTSVQEERAESPHQAVRCMHCHGNGHEHMAAALIAVDSPDHPIPPAGEWDGDFHTKMDLFKTQDRATCLSCHTSVVGMPKSFRSIDVAQHLAEQGAENVNARNVCFECHSGHSPGI
ncbi:MAG: hypothetical protein KDB01_09385 [Planctomycetaceae bacterium]|nr:hypothetical protein [Planctomycetaceae bacterium]